MSKLVQLSVLDLVQELSSGNPTPGGGSVAALCGALGAALSTMVSRLTVGKEKFKDVWESMEKVRQGADELSERFLNLVQEDSDVYQQVITALRLPKETEDQKSSRRATLQKALKRAAMVPLHTLRASEQLICIAREAVERGNPNALTDAVTAVYLARTAATVASYNVRINLSEIKDEAFVAKCKNEVEETLERMKTLFAEADEYVNARLA